MRLDELRRLPVLDAAFTIHIRYLSDVTIEEVFPSLTADQVAQVWNRVHEFAKVTSRWGAETMDLFYERISDERSREQAFDELATRHDREYEEAWTDFSKNSRIAGESLAQRMNRQIETSARRPASRTFVRASFSSRSDRGSVTGLL
jgi:hypothetical protein